MQYANILPKREFKKVDGRGYAGRGEKVTLPKLTLKTEEFRAGGMDVPIALDLGMEKLEADLTFAEYDPELFKLFGLIESNAVALTLRGALHEIGKSDVIPMVLHLRGTLRERNFGAWKAGEKATLKVAVDLRTYKMVYGEQNFIEIDAENREGLKKGMMAGKVSSKVPQQFLN